MRRRAFVSGAALMLLLFAHEVRALDPANAISQYAHTAWRVREGYFPAPPAALTQTRDGYLWIGTEAGLFRFDGVRFEPWKPPGSTRLPDDRIVALLGARDGSLWIGGAKGLSQWKDGRLTVHARIGRFCSLIEDRNGVVWAGHTRSLTQLPPLCHMEGGALRCVAAPGTPTLRYISAIHEDRHGELWLGGGGAVCRGVSHPECHPIPGLAAFADKLGVFAIAEDAEGALWAAAASSGTWKLVSGRWQRFSLASDVAVDSETMHLDRNGALWIGTLNRGLIHIVNGRAETFTQADGLSGDVVLDIFEDREGNIWVGTSNGIDRFRDVNVATITRREGLPTGVVLAVTPARSGGVWLADRSGLVHLDGRSLTSYQNAASFPKSGLSCMLEDSRGRLWVGVDDSLGFVEGGRFARVAMPNGEDVGMVRAIAEDGDGDLWVVTVDPRHPLVRIRDQQVVETIGRDRIGNGLIDALLADPDGGMWLALDNTHLRLLRNGVAVPSVTVGAPVRSLWRDRHGLWAVTGQGLRYCSRGRVEILGTQSGLPCNDIESAVASDDGALWLKTSCGLVRIASGELDAWVAQPRRQVQTRVFDAFDGAQAGLPPFTPRSAKSSDGRLWFAIESGGLQVLDPKHLHHNDVPPPVDVLRVIADRRTYEPHGRLELLPLTRDVEIDYAALSFSVPEKVRFRYKLEGADSDWQDVGTRRQAFYTNLGYGSYRFVVVACNDEGVWNRSGATIAFVIPPAFHQTRMFLALCIAALAALVWLVYRWRLREVQTRLERAFEERLGERTKIARDIHDTLLQGFLSSSMQLHVAIDELPADSPARGRLQRVQELMRQVIEEGRMVLRGLRAGEQGTDDLEQTLARVPAELEIRDAADLRIIVDGTVRPLRRVVRDEVHRIAREALVNAFRHADARHIEVEIEYGSRQFRVVIRDDGHGIDPDVLLAGREDHWGLSGMRERTERIGARLKVWSRVDSGTEVELAIPSALAFE